MNKSFLAVALLLTTPLSAQASIKAGATSYAGIWPGTDVSATQVTPTSATTASTVANIFARRYDVMDFGAQCDGARDDTAAFSLASQTVSAAGGGVITKPTSKSCVVCGANIYRNTVIDGGALQGGEIIEKTGCTTAAFQSENFASNTGTGKYYGHDASVPSWFGLQNIRVNASGGTAGPGIQFYGNMPILRHIYVYNAYGDDFYTEASTSTQSSTGGNWRAQEESYIDDWYANGSRHGVGFRYRGSYDGHMGAGLAMFNYSCGFISEVGSGYSGGLDWIEKLHTYGNGVGDGTSCGIDLEAQANAGLLFTDGDNMTMGGSAIGSHINQLYQYNVGYNNKDGLTVLGNDIVIDDYHGFTNASNTGYNVIKWAGYGSAGGLGRADITCQSSSAANVTGLKVTSNGGTFNDVNVHDCVASGDVGANLTGQNNVFKLKLLNNTTGLAYSGYNTNQLRALINTSSGQTAYTGTPSASDIWEINEGGTSSAHVEQLPGPLTVKGGVTGTTGTYTGTLKTSAGLGTGVRGIYSGTTDTATTSDGTIQWNSGSANAKAQSIPACSSVIAGQYLAIKDVYATAATYNITVTPASGTIDGAASYVINTNRGVVRLQCDGTTNWAVM